MDKLHFAHLISTQAKKYGEKTALCYREKAGDPWNKLSWNSFSAKVSALAKAFIEIGLNEQDKVAQFSQNKAENLIVDFALFVTRGVMVPMYATSTAAQVEFIVNDARIETMFVGDQQQYNTALEVLENSEYLKRIIVFDKSVVFKETAHSMYFEELLEIGNKSTKHFEVQQRESEATGKDLSCILYTSGTTGNPKGVMLSHSCFKEAICAHTLRLSTVTDKDSSIAFLPLSHVFERTWCYFCIFKGVTIYINQYPTEIQQTIKEVRPTLVCAVPRFWEKVYAGVNDQLASFSPFMKGVVAWAIETGKIYNLDYLRTGKKPTIFLSLKYNFADKFIFAKLKRVLGIENAKMLPTAGARLADEIAVFFRSIGIPIVYGYGLTETTATVSCFDYTNFEIGSVGITIPDLEVRIGDDHEIQVKGKTVFPGYYNNPEANKAAFTEDGWFRTGDAGYFKGEHLILTERIKDLFKTSNGKYIAPQEIETRLTLDPYIEQAAIIGDERNFVTAIICPSINALKEYANKNGIKCPNSEELIKHPDIQKLIEERISIQQKDMANYEKIKRFTLINKSFSIETGELTNTLKIRRAVITQKYKKEIEDMYA